jgi:hypothetical protein
MRRRPFRPGRICDELRPGRDRPLRRANPPSGGKTRILAMESVATLLIVMFQLFFGWCGEDRHDPPPPAQCESNGDC